MILLDVQELRKHYGPQPVLDGVTFQVRPGERIGLVGPNGSGKTTLMRIIAGHEEGDGGSCALHAAAHLGYLEQQPQFDPQHTLRDEAQSALAGLIAIEREALEVAEMMATANEPAEHERLAARYDHLQHELSSRDAYNLDHRIDRVLDGLGFRREAHSQPVVSLSGGEQNRLILAKLLLAEPNVMLLDEPSNHLDIEATEWLESFLLESSAAMIVVSHDRYFLDRVTNRTLELFRGTVDSYVGNFSAYWRQKEERLLVQKRTFEKQQTEIAKAEDFIRRNHYGQKAAQAEDRRKKLSRIERVEAPREIAAPPMAFPKADRAGDLVLQAEGLAKRFERPLFRDVTLRLARGERWALIGPNGAGKTTLLKCLLGQTAPDAGESHLGHGVDVGYFDQHLTGLADDTQVVDSVRPPRRVMETQERRDLLARFGLVGDAALQTVGSLSGGQRCRAALARLAALAANFLVLDEPTNHLDLWARDSLEHALRDFGGSVLFVSHDRYFINQVADHVIAVERDRVRIVEGNYDSYQERLAAERRGAAGPAADSAARGGGGKTARSASKSAAPSAAKARSKDAHKAANPAATDRSPGKAPRRPTIPPAPHKSGGTFATAEQKAKRTKRRFPYRKLADIEHEIFEREGRIAALGDELNRGETHRDGDRVRQIQLQLVEEQSALASLYEHWEEAAELNR